MMAIQSITHSWDSDISENLQLNSLSTILVNASVNMNYLARVLYTIFNQLWSMKNEHTEVFNLFNKIVADIQRIQML